MRRRRHPEFHIEIAPVNLIDLVLILLIFFITTTTFLNLKLIEMSFPEAASATPPEQTARKIVVNIDEKGNFFIDRQPVPRNGLVAAFSGLPSTTEALIGADENARHGDFVMVVDALKANGLNKINIVTRVKGRAE